MMPIPRGQDPLNDKRFRIVVIDDNSFSLKDPITLRDIDSTNFPPYVTGGSCNKIATNFEYNA
jgi:hypothetical protein